MNRKRFLVASLAALALGFGINSANAQGVTNSHPEFISGSNNNKILNRVQNYMDINSHAELINSHPELVSASPYSASDVMFRHSEALAEEFPNSTSMRHSESDSPKNLISTDPSHSFRMTGNGVTTGFAAEIDLNNIGDTLTGTNHVTYSSTDPGNATGHVDVTNPDGSIQTIYYTYTKPDNYTETSTRVYQGSATQAAIENKVFKNITSSASGGAVWHTYSSGYGNVNSDFIENTSSNQGGALQQHDGANSDFVKGDFIKNHSENWGGSIVNRGNINSITGDFIENSAEQGGGLYLNSKVQNVTGNFIGNSSIYTGSAIICSKIQSLNGNFIGNFVSSNEGVARGAAIDQGIINSITGNFIGNYITTNKNYAYGGAISYLGVGSVDGEGNPDGGIINSNFYNNNATSDTDNYLALGGAIYIIDDFTRIVADGEESIFSGNYTQDYRGKIPNAIFIGDAGITLTLNAINDGTITFDDQIDGGTVISNQTIERTSQNNLKITGDETGTINLNNDVSNFNITHENVTTNVLDGKYLNHAAGEGINSLTMESGTLNINRLGIESPLNFAQLNLNGGAINLNNVEVDLANEKMGRITADTYGANPNGEINVNSLKLTSDATKNDVQILFADKEIANNVQYTGSETVSYSPIYKYDVNYLVDEDNKGYFTFARSASGGSDGYNPSVLASPVATQAAAQVTMEHTFNYSFSNSDTFMLLPKKERIAIRNRNKYAIAENELPDGANPLYQMQDTSSAWFKPYASFENVPLKNGPKVNVISYGALAGYDTDLKELKRGWARAWTGFVGYNGANLNYNGVTTTQNGGILGGTLTMYKGNFFNATTLSAGATVGENSTMYGHDTTTSLLAGIGNKTGYNLEFIDGKFIVQPSLFLGYTFVKTFDYTNAAGVRIDSDPSHTMQISPGLKFIGNLKHGWQPYIGVNMVWNVLNNSHVKANSVTLPQMSVKPYIQYGIGLQKTVKDNFVAYGQAMVQNGGRNGISLTAGFRWAIGRDKKPIEKVQNNSKEIKVSNKSVINSVKTDKTPSVKKSQQQKMNKIKAFFENMNGEPIAQTTITPTKAIISKL